MTKAAGLWWSTYDDSNKVEFLKLMVAPLLSQSILLVHIVLVEYLCNRVIGCLTRSDEPVSEHADQRNVALNISSKVNKVPSGRLL